MSRFFPALILTGLLCTPSLQADDGDNKAAALFASQKKLVQKKTEQAEKDYEGNPDVLVRYGLVADRKAKKVTVQAVINILSANDPVEFYLITDASEHDYEALATSFATDEDIRKALTFIGMQPGTPVDGRAMRLWPKGEHCKVRFKLNLDGELSAFSPETLVIDERTKAAPPEKTYIFTRRPENLSGPGSIISAYNEPTSVLDTPDQRSKDEIYNNHVAGKVVAGLGPIMFEIEITPEFTDGHKRIKDVTLKIAPGIPPLSTGAPNLSYQLITPDGKS